jgi:molybdopterin-guanine dinucleotide biosynthesis protein A
VKISGVIQAGGHSVRMGGQPKALMEVGGRSIIARVLAALAPAVDDLLIVTNTPELYEFLKVPMVADVYPDHGSLGGIYSGLKAADSAAALTVACDMPFLHTDVIRLVVARAGEDHIAIPRVGNQLETLHAAYGKSCLPHIAERLAAGRLKIADFLECVPVVEIAEEEVARYRDPRVVFMNVNTPDELERARALAQELG